MFAFAGGFAFLGSISPGTLLLLLHMGLSSTAFNFSLWFYALSVLPVTRVANLQYLIAPLGVALSVIFLREPLTLTLGGRRDGHCGRHHHRAAGRRAGAGGDSAGAEAEVKKKVR